MPGPVEPRLLKRAGATRNYLIASVLVGILTSGLVIAQAWLLARAVAIVLTYRALPGDWLPTLVLLLAIFAARGLLAWVNSVLAHRSAAAVKSRLRRDVLAAHLIRPVASSATLTKVTTTGLDALDGYFSKYLPQLGLAASVPFLVGGVLLLADWPSALIVAFTLPLVPVFMALIGWTTQAATRRAFTRADKLANHFADLIQGLPTLQAFARARAQRRGLEITEEQFRGQTIKVLYTAFLSSFALELLASLSVALVAVTVGFRLAGGEMPFETALFVLILAPEAFLPVRQVGVHFHDSADGVAAANAALDLIELGDEPGGGGAAGGRGVGVVGGADGDLRLADQFRGPAAPRAVPPGPGRGGANLRDLAWGVPLRGASRRARRRVADAVGAADAHLRLAGPHHPDRRPPRRPADPGGRRHRGRH